MVLVVAGALKTKVAPEDLVGDVLKLVADGMRLKEAVAEIAEQNSVSKSVLYQLALDAK
jgi:16S rRNA (cytidine1402-2'-O)-methyltransferase